MRTYAFRDRFWGGLASAGNRAALALTARARGSNGRSVPQQGRTQQVEPLQRFGHIIVARSSRALASVVLFCVCVCGAVV